MARGGGRDVIPWLLGRASAHLRRRRTIAAVGGASLIIALGVVFLPGLFPESAFRPVSRVLGSQVAVGLFAAVAALFAAAALRESVTRPADDSTVLGDDRRATDGELQTDAWLPAVSPERAHYDEVRTAGTEVDRALDVDPDEDSADDVAAMRKDARNRIRTTAVDVLADFEDCDRETAARRIADGTWTDDRRAAAFLAGVDHAPLVTRIRDWASGERFERWATSAVTEIEARAGGRGVAAAARASEAGVSGGSGDAAGEGSRDEVGERSRDAPSESSIAFESEEPTSATTAEEVSR